jgi:hypothetical protein
VAGFRGTSGAESAAGPAFSVDCSTSGAGAASAEDRGSLDAGPAAAVGGCVAGGRGTGREVLGTGAGVLGAGREVLGAGVLGAGVLGAGGTAFGVACVVVAGGAVTTGCGVADVGRSVAAGRGSAGSRGSTGAGCAVLAVPVSGVGLGLTGAGVASCGWSGAGSASVCSCHHEFRMPISCAKRGPSTTTSPPSPTIRTARTRPPQGPCPSRRSAASPVGRPTRGQFRAIRAAGRV